MDSLFEEYWHGQKKSLEPISTDMIQTDDEEGKAWTTFKQAVQKAIKSESTTD